MIRLVLLRLLESYFRHRFLHLLPVLLLSLFGIANAFYTPPAYIARGNLYVQKDTLLTSLTALRGDAWTYQTPAELAVSEMYELLSSNAFIRAIIQQTDLESSMALGQDVVEQTISEVRQAIWVQRKGSNLIMIGAAHEEPQIAYQLILATVETFVQWKINVNRDESTAAQEFFAKLIETYRAELEPAQQALTNYLTLHPEPLRGERPATEAAEIARLQTAVDIVKSRLQNAEEKEESARLALAQTASDVRQSYFMVDAPLLPTAPERSKKELLMTVMIFGIVGALLSAVGIIGSALLDRTLRFPIDVRHGLNLPVLGMVPESMFELPAAVPSPISVEPAERTQAEIPRTKVIATSQNGASQNGVSQNGAHVHPLVKRMRHPLGRK